MERWTLELKFANNMGNSHIYALEVDPFTAREFDKIEAPAASEVGRIMQDWDMSHLVYNLKNKQFRKDFFVSEATRLGHLLADRMADKEGWHGVDREINN